MEDFSKDEILKIDQFKQLFKTDSLTREQIEFILGRKIEPIVLLKSKVKKEEVKKPVKVKCRPKNQHDIDLNIFSDEEKRALRKHKKDQIVDFHIPNIFRESHSDIKPYKIEKIRAYRNDKFRADRSDWQISGPVDIFQVNDVITQLVNRMTANLPDNVKLQVSLTSSVNDTVNQTKLLNKNEIVNKLSDWVHFFIDYHDMELENITFKLIAIELPTGAGRVNTIISVDSKRSIIQVKNNDTICLARAIIVGLAVNHRDKIQTVFANNLTNDEVKEINKGRRETNKTQINQGILSDNEKKYLTDGRKMQDVLAKALHRLCKIPIKSQGNDFQDAKLFEEALDISVHIYNAESRQIYKGIDRPVNINIFMSDNHYDVISNLSGFTCDNASHHQAEEKQVQSL